MCLTVLSGEATTCHPLLGYAVSHLSFSTPALISFLPLVFPYSVPGTPLNLYPCPGISKNPLPRPPPNFSPPHLSSPPRSGPAPSLAPFHPAERPIPLSSQLLPPLPHSSYLLALRVTPTAGGSPAPRQAGKPEKPCPRQVRRVGFSPPGLCPPLRSQPP